MNVQTAQVLSIAVHGYVGFVAVMEALIDLVADAYRMGFVLCFVCGFTPSRFLRLDRTGAPG